MSLRLTNPGLQGRRASAKRSSGAFPRDSERPRSIRRQAGFSLLEVLVTLIIFAVGLLGLAAMQGRSLQSNHSAYMRTQATNLAYEMLDTWRADRGAVLTAGGLPPDLAAWQAQALTVLPDGAVAVQRDGPGNSIFTVNITWRDSRWDADVGNQNVTFTVVSQI